MCIYSTKGGDTIYFYEEGGVDVGDVDSKAHKLPVSIGETIVEGDRAVKYKVLLLWIIVFW